MPPSIKSVCIPPPKIFDVECAPLQGVEAYDEREHQSGAPVAIAIQKLLQRSIPCATVDSVRQIGNARLWRSFCAMRQNCIVAGTSQVKLLFYGTHSQYIDELIGRRSKGGSESGLCPRAEWAHCQRYDWFTGEAKGETCGMGCYFSEHAAYPVYVHPKERNGEFCYIVVAEVELGRVKDLGSGYLKCLPPPKDKEDDESDKQSQEGDAKDEGRWKNASPHHYKFGRGKDIEIDNLCCCHLPPEVESEPAMYDSVTFCEEVGTWYSGLPNEMGQRYVVISRSSHTLTLLCAFAAPQM